MIKQKARPIPNPITAIHVAPNQRSHSSQCAPPNLYFLRCMGLLSFPLKGTSHVSCRERQWERLGEISRERDINFQQQGEARICLKSIRRLTPQNPYPIFFYKDFLPIAPLFSSLTLSISTKPLSLSLSYPSSLHHFPPFRILSFIFLFLFSFSIKYILSENENTGGRPARVWPRGPGGEKGIETKRRRRKRKRKVNLARLQSIFSVLLCSGRLQKFKYSRIFLFVYAINHLYSFPAVVPTLVDIIVITPYETQVILKVYFDHLFPWIN